ncbi:methyl-accepting chemotaxis protein [candidate division KSB1 bacterium]
MLKNVKVGPKLIGGFLVVALIIVVVGFIGTRGINLVAEAADIILDEEVPIADASMEMMIAVISGRDIMGEYLLATDLDELDGIEAEFNQTVEDFDFFCQGILNGVENEEVKIVATDNSKIIELTRKADEYHGKFTEAAIEMMKFKKQALSDQSKVLSTAEALAYDFMEEVDNFSGLADETMDEVEAQAAIEMNTAMENADAAANSSFILVVVCSAIGFAMAVALGFLLSKAITNPLKKVTEVAEAISKGKLDNNIDLFQKDELGHLAESFRKMSEALQAKADVAGQIAEGNLEVEVEILSEEDALGKSMVSMREGLQKADSFQKKLSEYQTGEVEKLSHLFDKMAKGDLTVAYNVAAADEETGEICKAFSNIKSGLDATLASLNDILGQVTTASDQVTSGAGQVSDSSQSLSQGATEQASSLEEVSASITEIASQTKTNAENAGQANSLAGKAKDIAETGNDQMKNMVEAMGDINHSSNEISKIIKVIDEIAFQTNLLALNAAVEAARAGVHGKGFAVVAEEVRNLAQRSATAAKETTELIEGSVKNVDNGTSIADETAKALEEIVEGVTKVSDIVGEIASASNEQAEGIEQVNTALNQIDQVTQSNTANAEESAAASEELSSQAEQLKQMVSRFRLDVKNVSTVSKAPVKEASYKTESNGKNKTSNGGSQEQKELIALDDDDFAEF